jgi:3-oxoacyl-[acyl-carrier protein] reductase
MNSQRLLLTGASGLIGRALVTKYLEENWSVVAQVNKNPESLSEFSSRLEIVHLDLALPGNGRKLAEQIGKFDLVINNAADQSVISPSEGEIKDIEALFRVNLFAPLEIMAAAKSKGASTCINISSIEAVSARPGHEIYGASKAALESLTKSLSVSFAPMRINAVRLGLVGDSGIENRWPEGVAAWRNAVPLKRYASPDEVADFIYEISKTSFSYATGAIFDFDGGKSASPGW